MSFAVLLAILLKVTVAGPSGQHVLAAADLAKMPRARITLSDHGKTATFEGTELRNVIANAAWRRARSCAAKRS